MYLDASRKLKWLYCLALATGLFPTLLAGASGWIAMAVGAGWLGGFGGFGLLPILILSIYRIVTVVKMAAETRANSTNRVIAEETAISPNAPTSPWPTSSINTGMGDTHRRESAACASIGASKATSSISSSCPCFKGLMDTRPPLVLPPAERNKVTGEAAGFG